MTYGSAYLCRMVVHYAKGTCGQLMGDCVPQALHNRLRMVQKDFSEVSGQRGVLTPPVF